MMNDRIQKLIECALVVNVILICVAVALLSMEACK